MTLHNYTEDLEGFIEEASSYWANNPVISNLQWALAKRYLAGKGCNLAFIACGDHEKPTTFGLQTEPDRPLCLTGTTPLGHQGAELVRQLQSTFPAVVGEGRLSIDFATHSGLPQKRSVNMHLYRLDTLKEYPKYGTLRPTQKSDVDLLAVWIADFEDAIQAVKTQANYHQQALELIDRGTAFLYEVDGQTVAMAGSSRSAAGVACISLVYTPPTLRGRGYASAAVGALCENLLVNHQHCCLYADQANPASNKVYQRLGFFVVSDSVEVQFEKDEI